LPGKKRKNMYFIVVYDFSNISAAGSHDHKKLSYR